VGTLVNFAPELGHWISHNLDRGCRPADIIANMVQQKFDVDLAAVLVQAFVDARLNGMPAPIDSLTLELENTQYQYETPRIAAGPIIHTADRSIRVRVRIARPVAVVLENVLSNDECEQIIDLARVRLQISTVVDPASGTNMPVDYRDSEGMFFRLEENPLIARLDHRISQLMNMPVENGEGLQVLRYTQGCKNEPHFDYLIPGNDFNKQSLLRSGQRVSTLVMYLNDVEEGGETYFPEIGLSVLPKRGNAIYFEYANSLRQVDPKSLHASSAIVKGEKWAMTKWMRERKFISVNTKESSH